MLAVNSKIAAAHYVRARSLHDRTVQSLEIEDMGDGPPEGLMAARNALVQALLIEPDNPRALIWLGKTYMLQEKGLEPGIAALRRGGPLTTSDKAGPAPRTPLAVSKSALDEALIGSISPELRRRAERLLIDHPWGMRAPEPASRQKTEPYSPPRKNHEGLKTPLS